MGTLMAIINISFQESNKVGLQIWFYTETTTSIKKNQLDYVPVWIGHNAHLRFEFNVSLFFYFFIFPVRMNSDCTVHAHGFTMQETKCTVYRINTHIIQKKKIKNGSHSTIHPFKNYFATVFLVFNF